MIRHDLARFFGVNLDDVWRGDISLGHATSLVLSLASIPESQSREALAPNSTGWDAQTFLTADLYDLIHSLILGLSGKRMSESRRYPRPKPKQEVKKPTVSIADFDLGNFMAKINS